MKIENYKPNSTFAQKHLLTLNDYSADEILQVLSLALHLKAKQKAGIKHESLLGKTLAMIFTKSSTRTRVSFEVGMFQLGGHALFLSSNDIQLGRGETIGDTAQVLSRMANGIMIRTFKQSDVEGLAAHGSIPVINGLTDYLHPCQALADVMTMYERLGTLEGKKLAYVGDGNNVCHSLMIICKKLGIDFAAACPKGYEPSETIVNMTAGHCLLTRDSAEAVTGADAVYTDVWASMGQEGEASERLEHFKAYSVTSALMAHANKNAIFLHCLPAHRGEEVCAEVIDGACSAVFDEAENRLHAQKAVLALLMSGKSYAELMR